MFRLCARERLKDNIFAEFYTKFPKFSPSRTKNSQAIESKSSSIDGVCLVNMNAHDPLSEKSFLLNESRKTRQVANNFRELFWLNYECRELSFADILDQRISNTAILLHHWVKPSTVPDHLAYLR